MSAKKDAEERLEDIVSLAQSVIDRARAAQAAIAQIAPQPEREDKQ